MMLSRGALGVIVCSLCKGKLNLDQTGLACRCCRQTYIIENGIPLMFYEASKNSRIDFEKKENQIHFYAGIAESLEKSGFAPYANYLNFGYKPTSDRQYSKIELPAYCLNKNSVKLTLEVIGDCNIDGKQIIEIGCGRGGNMATMKEYYSPGFLVGVDICKASLNSFQKNHRYDEILLIEGDAENLPLEKGTFDIAFSLESSHAYPNIYRFYEEVERVLKINGYFLYSDVLPVGKFVEMEELLLHLGFAVVGNRDITSNVLLSCNERAEKRLETFALNPKINSPKILENFLAVPGSDDYNKMKEGLTKYKIYAFKKVRS
jgi:SAM-dependent methyltransferase/uncharacterized protein YbaR (Trm112 family)